MLLLLFVFTAPAMAQTESYLIHGKVTSFEESLALEGVSIKIKGTSYFTGTQADGTFSMDITNTKQVLVIELSGYETQEITVDNKKEFDIVLIRENSTAKQVLRSTPALTGWLHSASALNFYAAGESLVNAIKRQA